jgi:hypothetical protein
VLVSLSRGFKSFSIRHSARLSTTPVKLLSIERAELLDCVWFALDFKLSLQNMLEDLTKFPAGSFNIHWIVLIAPYLKFYLTVNQKLRLDLPRIPAFAIGISQLLFNLSAVLDYIV